jgi:cyclase
MANKTPFKKEGMFKGANPLLFQLAHDLRKNMTDAEKHLWHHLKLHFEGYKFRRQHPLGPYIADFYCHKAKLVIELDGSIHNQQIIKENDIVRQRVIEELGITVMRFQNKEVFNHIDLVLNKIKTQLSNEINSSL